MDMTELSTDLVFSLADSRATIERVGGKGASLARLAATGLPVPDGFHITTEAYKRFVDENNLQARIQAALEQVDLQHPATLEAASRAIREMFAQAQTPPDLASVIAEAYAGLPGWEDTGESLPVPVAVRSSATAEDLPEASFAGQQETYLNVRGAGEVLAAVQRCWGSLWTGRAISYRARQSIAPSGLSLAVVVQILVPAEAAGILFTANPLNGRRDQAMISAAWGLGEAIVGGLVTPDMLIVDKTSGLIQEQQIADKQQMTVRSDSGTLEQDVPSDLRCAPVLNAGTTAELVKLGLQIEALYGMPMDIEWAFSRGCFYILQARPITALPELEVPLTIEWKPPLPDGIYMRTSVVDLMPDPLSPLYATLGISSMVEQMYPLGRRLIGGDPVFPDGYFTNINSYAYMNAHFTNRAWGWILFRMLPAYPRLLKMLVRFWREEAHPGYQKAVAEWKQKDMQQMTVAELWQAVQAVVNAAGYYTGALMFATMGASAGSEGLLTRLYEK